MRIIQQGIVGNQIVRKFTCHYCHCIFEAEPGEYIEVPDTQLEYAYALYSYEPRYRSTCPTCGRPVFYEEPRPL